MSILKFKTGAFFKFDELFKYVISFKSFHPIFEDCPETQNVQNPKIPIFQFLTKVIGFFDSQRILYFNKSGYVHRRDFDKLLEYEISFESFNLCLKFEQLLQNFERFYLRKFIMPNPQCNAGE